MVHMLNQSLRNLDQITTPRGAITCAGTTFPVFSTKLFLRGWLFLSRKLTPPPKTKQKKPNSFSAYDWLLLGYKMYYKHKNNNKTSLELLV